MLQPAICIGGNRRNQDVMFMCTSWFLISEVIRCRFRDVEVKEYSFREEKNQLFFKTMHADVDTYSCVFEGLIHILKMQYETVVA